MPVLADRVSRHARPSRRPELDQLKDRIAVLEHSIRELTARLEAIVRQGGTGQPVKREGCGGIFNMSGGSLDGRSNFSFGEASTMNNYFLNSLLDECWPDTPS